MADEITEEIVDKVELNREEDLQYLTYEDYKSEIDEKTKNYHDRRLRITISQTIFEILLLILLVIVDFGGFLSRILKLDSSYSILGVLLISVIIITILFLSNTIFSYLGEKVELEFEFSTLTWKKWAKRRIISYLLLVTIFTLIIWGIYSFMLLSTSWWWLYSFFAYFFFTGFLQFLAPILIVPLFYKLESFPEGELRNRMIKLADDMGVKYKDIYLWRLSDATTKVNAAVMGFGSSIRIVLGDTLVQKFRDDEIEVVMCHELGHQKSKDVYRLLLFSGIITLVIFVVIHLSLNFIVEYYNYGSISAPATIVFFIAAMTVVQELLSIITMWYSRRREIAADITAINKLGDIQIYESAFTRLAKTSMSYPDPSRLEVLFLYSHPPIRDRIKYAKAYVKSI